MGNSLNVEFLNEENIKKVNTKKQDFYDAFKRATTQGGQYAKQATMTVARSQSQNDLTTEGTEKLVEHSMEFYREGNLITKNIAAATTAASIRHSQVFHDAVIRDGEERLRNLNKHIDYELKQINNAKDRALESVSHEVGPYIKDCDLKKIDLRIEDLKLRSALADKDIAKRFLEDGDLKLDDKLKDIFSSDKSFERFIENNKVINFSNHIKDLNQNQAESLFMHICGKELDLEKAKFGDSIKALKAYQDKKNEIFNASKMQFAMKTASDFAKNADIVGNQIKSMIGNKGGIGLNVSLELEKIKKAANPKEAINKLLEACKFFMNKEELAELEKTAILYSKLVAGESIAAGGSHQMPFYYQLRNLMSQTLTGEGFFKMSKGLRTGKVVLGAGQTIGRAGVSIAEKGVSRSLARSVNKGTKLKGELQRNRSARKVLKKDLKSAYGKAMGKNRGDLIKLKNESKKIGDKILKNKNKIARREKALGRFGKFKNARGHMNNVLHPIDYAKRRLKNKIASSKLFTFLTAEGTKRGMITGAIKKIFEGLAKIPKFLLVGLMVIFLAAACYMVIVTVVDAVSVETWASEKEEEEGYIEEVDLSGIKDLSVYAKKLVRSKLVSLKKHNERVTIILSPDGGETITDELTFSKDDKDIQGISNVKDILSIAWVAFIENNGNDVENLEEEQLSIAKEFISDLFDKSYKEEDVTDEDGVNRHIITFDVLDESFFGEENIIQSALELEDVKPESLEWYEFSTYEDYMDINSNFGSWQGFDIEYIYDAIIELMDKDWSEYGIDLSFNLNMAEMLSSEDINGHLKELFGDNSGYYLRGHAQNIKSKNKATNKYKYTLEDKYRFLIVKAALSGVNIIEYYNGGGNGNGNWDFTSAYGVEANYFGDSMLGKNAVPTDGNGVSLRGLDCIGFSSWAYLTGSVELNQLMYDDYDIDTPVLNVCNLPNDINRDFVENNYDYNKNGIQGVTSVWKTIGGSVSAKLISDGGMKPGDIISFDLGSEHFGIYAGNIDGVDYALECDGSNGAGLNTFEYESNRWAYYISLNDIIYNGSPNDSQDHYIGRDGGDWRDLQSLFSGGTDLLTSYNSASGQDAVDMAIDDIFNE